MVKIFSWLGFIIVLGVITSIAQAAIVDIFDLTQPWKEHVIFGRGVITAVGVMAFSNYLND